MRSTSRLYALVALALFALGAAAALPDAVVPSGDEQRIGPRHLLYLEDAAGTLSANAAREALARGEFRALPPEGGNFGITGSTYWLHVRIANPGRAALHRLLVHDYAPTDLLELHLLAEDGTMHRLLRGDSVVPEPPTARRRLPVFPLAIAPGATVEALLRIRSSSNLNSELRLWEAQAFEHREGWITLLYGLLFGMLGASVIFLVLAYREQGERGVLIAVPYLVCFAVYLGFLNGFWAIYWPQGALAAVNAAHMSALALLFGLGARFYRAFLQLRRQGLRALDRAMQVLEWGAYALLLYPLLPLPLIGVLFAVITGLGPLFSSAGAFWLMWRRHPQATVFATGWAVAHASSFAGMLRVSGALPNSDLLLHLPAIGCALALLFFARAISDQLAQQRRNASEDFLTGAANRRRFDERGTEEFARARRYQRPLSLVVLDIDHFKSINDTLGHAAGDQVLREVAVRCREGLRTTDLLARTGGEEFVLLLVETGLEAARAGAERIREALEAEPILGRTVTASFGVTAAAATDTAIADTLRRADGALYVAKSAGRNRVCVAPTA